LKNVERTAIIDIREMSLLRLRKRKECEEMKKRSRLFKLAAFLLALAPVVMEASRSTIFFFGEPEMPVKRK